MTPEPDPDPTPDPDPPTPSTVSVTYRFSANADNNTTVWLQNSTTWGDNVSGSSKSANSTGDFVVNVAPGSYYLMTSGPNWSDFEVKYGINTLGDIPTSSVTDGTTRGTRSTNAISIQSNTVILISKQYD